jgi:5-formyltetrahydrofolate cyclo-ligase
MPSKPELRQGIRRRLAALPRERFHTEGVRALSFLQNSPYWTSYPVLLVFLSRDTEIDTSPLLEAALGDKKRVFAPVSAGGRLRFHRVLSPAGPWRQGAFHIREPEPAAPEFSGPGDFPALVITPGLAFDVRGNRLGQGGGFYDRFFADLAGGFFTGPRSAPRDSTPPYFSIGLCLETQIIPQVPVQAWDSPVKALCTGERFTPSQG